ncbi:uncharacterized protein L969DRAFT_56120 [Mixia osmundae IAM 14324]|uniref:RNA methyltransferase n=1 Tax=Mixia osmundae (strain CBS 9802 / IAM 14324 / JCM 22182 / KY 12970) TaxID=764103 RepID=G7E3Y2_MIXOS|nr:uncharacterized protein L969DRAFT_56120 [Mixia osmundae IAM 14324]KEI41988.1 hypothetical protein L969DRAFT_56120 [Mixia osmundae IAM 14324]GAA97542.1 hypothetical protein E5Q_04220 [Mixia osmundae IAM 14324]
MGSGTRQIRHGRGSLVDDSEDEAAPATTTTEQSDVTSSVSPARTRPDISSKARGKQRALGADIEPATSTGLMSRADAEAAGRASAPTERTRLLLSAPSNESDQTLCEQEALRRRRPRMTASEICCQLLIALICVIFIVFANFHMVVGKVMSDVSLASCASCAPLSLSGDPDSERRQREMVQRGLRWTGPHEIELDLNSTAHSSDSIGVIATFRAGVDVRKALGYAPSTADPFQLVLMSGSNVLLPYSRHGVSGTWFHKLEERMFAAVIREWSSVDVNLRSAYVWSNGAHAQQDDQSAIIKLALGCDGIRVPLVYGSDDTDDWLQTVLVPMRISVPDSQALASFANATLAFADREQTVELQVAVKDVRVQLGSSRPSNSLLGRILARYRRQSIDVVETTLRETLPALPKGARNISSLVQLSSYRFYPINSTSHNITTLALEATATVSNPFVLFDELKPFDLDARIPWRLPFSISMALETNATASARSVPLAQVHTLPFSLRKGQANFTLAIEGSMTPFQTMDPSSAEAAFSTFLTRFVKGQDNLVQIQYSAAQRGAGSAPPAFLQPLLKPYVVPMNFPGSNSTEQLIKDLRIENMKIDPSGGDLMCSGKVVGQLNLPEEMATLSSVLDISAIWPDILVYDGDVTDTADSTSNSWPPSPAPANAFARLRTPDWQAAQTLHQGNVSYIVSEIKQVPLDLLPGRSDVFRRYVGKILFGGGSSGVRTGIKGRSDCQADVQGLGQISLRRLPSKSSRSRSRPRQTDQMIDSRESQRTRRTASPEASTSLKPWDIGCSTKEQLHGNYKAYYGKRDEAAHSPDPRLAALDPAWFKHGRILDIGCNVGKVTIEVARRLQPYKVIGVDLDDSLIQHAKSKVRHAFSVQQPFPIIAREAKRRKQSRGDDEEVCGDPDFRPRSDYFPDCFPYMFGDMPKPRSRLLRHYEVLTQQDEVERSHRRGKEGRGKVMPKLVSPFPLNIEFKQRCWPSEGISDDDKGYNVILAFSVVKWIHLHGLDAGLRQFFERVFVSLLPGGRFILESHPAESYNKACKRFPVLTPRRASLQITPEQFERILLDEIGFKSVDHIGGSEAQAEALTKQAGFKRPLSVYHKADGSWL